LTWLDLTGPSFLHSPLRLPCRAIVPGYYTGENLTKVEVKAAALHAVALVLGAPKTSASTPAAAASTTSAAAGGGGGGHTDEDGDEVMGNAAAADGALREERGSLCKMLFGRLGVCNNKSAAGALLLELARQPVPEVWRGVTIPCGM